MQAAWIAHTVSKKQLILKSTLTSFSPCNLLIVIAKHGITGNWSCLKLKLFFF